MNLILFHPHETRLPLPLVDPRAGHILKVLRRKAGDEFDAGIIDGPRGKARLEAIGPGELRLSFRLDLSEPELFPLRLLIGLPRPQAARRILQEATALGVAEICWVRTDKGEPSYATSRLWTTDEWKRHLITGAEQAFSTRLPQVRVGLSLEDALASAARPAGARLALDNYEAAGPISQSDAGHRAWTLAVGAERGWSAAERDLLRASGFSMVHLGTRVLRTETACTAAITIIRERLGTL